MDTQTTLGSLSLFTIVAVLVIVGIAAVMFFRKRSNRKGLDGRGMTTNLDEVAARNEDPPRARDAR